MNQIYVARYNTESGDHGVLGYWLEEPNEEQLTEHFKAHMPYEFDGEDGDEVRYVFWEVVALSQFAMPEGIPTVPTI